MANSDAFEPRLKFLKEAANLLSLSSPTVSSALGTARDKLLEAHDEDLHASTADWHALRRESCGACGNTMIAGWSCTIHYEKSAQGKADKSKQADVPKTNVVYTCSRCARQTVQPLQPKAPKHIKKPRTSIAEEREPALDTTAALQSPSKVTKASKNQRRKARRAGLQATLDRNRTQNANQRDLGLGLMDFMQ